jgi:integrase
MEGIRSRCGVWIIPANRMKMRRPHRIPLAPQAIVIMKELRTLTGQHELLFPGARSPSRPLSENTLNAALRRLGYGFRAAASSLLNEFGKWNADAIEAQLAHVEANAVRKGLRPR